MVQVKWDRLKIQYVDIGKVKGYKGCMNGCIKHSTNDAFIKFYLRSILISRQITQYAEIFTTVLCSLLQKKKIIMLTCSFFLWCWILERTDYKLVKCWRFSTPCYCCYCCKKTIIECYLGQHLNMQSIFLQMYCIYTTL